MAKIRDGSSYLEQHLTANDYYHEAETVTGHWVGRGADRMGLRGEIGSGNVAFESLRRNRHPITGEHLTPRDAAHRVCFYDFQCSAQKSVSIMAVTMGDNRLLAAHDAAVERALLELESFASTQANNALIRHNRFTGNLTAAAFRHTSSRALDPQIHTHLVVANATWDEVSKSWRALNEYEMLQAIRYAGKVYQNELATACRRLGYDICETRDERQQVTGFEIKGISEKLLKQFSKRRTEVESGIEEFIKEHGRKPSVAETNIITRETRSQKLAEISTCDVLALQQSQLSSDEISALKTVKAQAERTAPMRVPDLGTLSRERESLHSAIAHIYERKSVARGHEVLAEALNQNLGYNDLKAIQKVAGQLGLVSLENEPWLRRRLATERGLKLERWAVKFIDSSRGKFEALARSPDKLPAHLSKEQAQALNSVLACRDQVQSLRGAAGVGKTTLIKSLNDVLRENGNRVVYCAPTTSAANTLRKDGIAEATTVSDFLVNGSVCNATRLNNAVFVVDEAGLSSNQQGAEILRIAERHNARVVFIGDSRQHSSVDAGDFLRVIEGHSQIHKVELIDIRRQLSEEYRVAVKMMSVGATRAGLEALNDMGAIKQGHANYLGNAVASYLEKSGNGTKHESVIAVTPTWKENRAFTELLRGELKRLGKLGKGETVTVLEPQQWTQAQKQNHKNFEAGLVLRVTKRGAGFKRGAELHVLSVEDRVVKVADGDKIKALPLKGLEFEVTRPREIEIAHGDKLLIRANERSLGLINGEIIEISTIENGDIRAKDGRQIDANKFRMLDHGFAVTSHKSQSKTADHVVIAAERLDAKTAYVACSRGRLTCSLHTPDIESLFSRLPSGERSAALDVLAESLPRSLHLDNNKTPSRLYEIPILEKMWGWWREQIARWTGREIEAERLTQRQY